MHSNVTEIFLPRLQLLFQLAVCAMRHQTERPERLSDRRAKQAANRPCKPTVRQARANRHAGLRYLYFRNARWRCHISIKSCVNIFLFIFLSCFPCVGQAFGWKISLAFHRGIRSTPRLTREKFLRPSTDTRICILTPVSEVEECLPRSQPHFGAARINGSSFQISRTPIGR